MSDKFGELEITIRTGNVEGGVTAALQLVESGTAPLTIFSECIEPVLADVGDKFGRLELFLPEMIESANVVKGVQEALKPHMQAEGQSASKGRVVICTITGDLHDIGKNIVKAMLEVNGFEVKDLGVDVTPAEAVRAASEFDADIIAFSALMLPSLPFVKDSINYTKEIEAYQDRFKILVGGGPVTREWAEANGADGYGNDAVDAVQEALKLLTVVAD